MGKIYSVSSLLESEYSQPVLFKIGLGIPHPDGKGFCLVIARNQIPAKHEQIIVREIGAEKTYTEIVNDFEALRVAIQNNSEQPDGIQ